MSVSTKNSIERKSHHISHIERVIESLTEEGAGCGMCVQHKRTLHDVASVDDLLNAAATETAPLFKHLEFEFLLEYEFTSHHTSFAAFCTATTKMSTAHVRSRENSNMASPGTTTGSTNRRPETQLTGFSPTSNTSSTISSTDSSSRPPPAACST